MKPGPKATPLGRCSCPVCHDPGMLVQTNKRGYPCAYCFKCETQVQPRDAKGSNLLMGHIHTWDNPDAAAVMLEAEDLEFLNPSIEPKAGALPPHLKKPEPAHSPPATEPAPPAQRTPTAAAPATLSADRSARTPSRPRASSAPPSSKTKPSDPFGGIFK